MKVIKYYKHYYYVISADYATRGQKIIYNFETQDTWEEYAGWEGCKYVHLKTVILEEFNWRALNE